MAETPAAVRAVRGCIERCGGSTSAVKDAGAKMMALGQAFSGMFVGDKVMKAPIASYAFEAVEIASHGILITTAKEVDDAETARICGTPVAIKTRPGMVSGTKLGTEC